MKHLFFILFVLMGLAGFVTYWSYPDVGRGVPVVYWVSDLNPARVQQIDLFHEWCVKQGLTSSHSASPEAELPGPGIELRLDAANRDATKMIIQGVSGVGGDVMDVDSGPGMVYFHSIGLLEDVTESALIMGFDPTFTYRAIEPEITLDGRQYLFPCNVFTQMYWVNKSTLSEYDLPVPPSRWTFETFERLGKQFVAAANLPGQRQTKFYADSVDLTAMHRSLGLSVFNETMTRCILDDERFVRCLELQYQWTYHDRIIPSAADAASFDTQSGYGGAQLQLFNRGNYAMIRMGRYALIQLRKFGELELAVVEPPHGGFPNTLIGTRAASVYIGSEHKDLAMHFLAFLASEDYNMQIVRDADALPPNPRYAQTEAFRRPPEHPNEWGCHEAFYNAAQEIAIGSVNSPFVLSKIVNREFSKAVDQFMNNRLSARAAAKQVADRVNDEIARSLSEDASLRPVYESLIAQQEQIDKLRTAGEPVPMELITNPFHRRYEQVEGRVSP